MLKTNVIASSISNLTDARYFAAWGVEAVSFDLEIQSIAHINAFVSWISGPKVIGRFSSAQEFQSIKQVASDLELDIIQLDPLAPPQWSFSKPIIREIVWGHHSVLPATPVVLKGDIPNFDVEVHKNELRDLCSQTQCYLDFNITPTDLETVLQYIKPHGIVLRGGDEEKVGFKSFDELDEIMEALEID